MNPWPDQFPLFPEAASTVAGEVDAIYFFGLAVAAFFSLLIAVLVLWFAVRYRRRSEDEIGRPEKAAVLLEIGWSVIPLLILMVMFAWGAKVFYHVRRPPENALEYYVTAKQWMWKFQHPDGNREINHLHVPAGQAIKLIMTSEDVIHSFFVPEFRVKQDVLPGRYTYLWFQSDRPGRYTLFCNEYCGAEHSLMIGSVTVMEPGDYEAWLSAKEPVAGGQQLTGEELFSLQVCDTCHKPDSAARAPMLWGLYGEEVAMADGSVAIADEDYLRESILNPGARIVKGYDAIMPTYAGRLSEDELLQLILYIKSIGPEGDAEVAAAPAAETEADAGSGDEGSTP